MSADNYYVLRKHPKGGYCFINRFMSDDRVECPTPKPDAERFPTMTDAMAAWHKGQEWDDAEPGMYPKYYNEYGLDIHPEVTEDPEGV